MRAAGPTAPAARASGDAPTARAMSRRSPGMCGKSIMETVEDIRHTRGNREVYARRKETIERIFGTAKEQHGSRYTQYIGKARMEMKAGLTFACMDLKKLARLLARKESGGLPFQEHPYILKKIYLKIKERCWSFT